MSCERRYAVSVASETKIGKLLINLHHKTIMYVTLIVGQLCVGKNGSN